MTTPSYKDIGKKVKDVLDKNFPAGLMKCSFKLPKSDNLTFEVNGTHNIDSGKLQKSIKGKLNTNVFSKDIAFTEQFNEGNEVVSTLDITPVQNLNSSIEFNYEPSTGRKTYKLKNNYINDALNGSGELEFRQIQPIFSMFSMFKPVPNIPLCVGGMFQVDSYKQSLDRYSAGIQYDNGQTCAAVSIANTKNLCLQLYHKLSLFDIVGEMNFAIDSKVGRMTVCVNKDIAQNKSVKFKLDCGFMSSMACAFPITESMKLTLGARIDLKNINGGGHKFGLQLDV